MTQEQINKLTELKKLRDAGILTEEELQAEKAKVLGYNQEQVIAESSSKTEESTSDVLVNSQGNEYGDVSENEPDAPELSEDESENDGVSLKTLIISLCVIALILVVYFQINGNDNEKTSFGEPTQATNEAVAYSNVDDAPIEEVIEVVKPVEEVVEEDDNEFAYDPWIGGMRIDGTIYRLCESRCYLYFEKFSKGQYKGTIILLLGNSWDDNDDKFDPSFGYLEGKVRAKADGNVLTVVMDDYTSRAFNEGQSNYFENGKISGQIFRITNNGGTYNAFALGDMELYFNKEMGTSVIK